MKRKAPLSPSRHHNIQDPNRADQSNQSDSTAKATSPQNTSSNGSHENRLLTSIATESTNSNNNPNNNNNNNNNNRRVVFPRYSWSSNNIQAESQETHLKRMVNNLPIKFIGYERIEDGFREIVADSTIAFDQVDYIEVSKQEGFKEFIKAVCHLFNQLMYPEAVNYTVTKKSRNTGSSQVNLLNTLRTEPFFASITTETKRRAINCINEYLNQKIFLPGGLPFFSTKINLK